MPPLHKWNDCLLAVAIGAVLGALLGAVVIGGVALLGDRPVAEDGMMFLSLIALFTVAGAVQGYGAYRETPKGNAGGTDV